MSENDIQADSQEAIAENGLANGEKAEEEVLQEGEAVEEQSARMSSISTATFDFGSTCLEDHSG